MKYLEWLKKELGEETFNKLFPQGSEVLTTLTSKLGEKKILEDDGKMVPYHRFDEVNKKLTDPENGIEALTKKLTKAAADLEEAKKGKKADPTLEDKFKELETKYTTLENTLKEKDTQLAINQKRSVVEGAFRKLNANETFLPTLLREFELKHPLDKLEIVDGQIKDSETILKPFSETFKPMFGEYVKDGNPPAPGSGNPIGPDYSKMTDAEFFAARQVEMNKK